MNNFWLVCYPPRSHFNIGNFFINKPSKIAITTPAMIAPLLILYSSLLYHENLLEISPIRPIIFRCIFCIRSTPRPIFYVLVVFGNRFKESCKNTFSTLQSPFNFEFINKVNQVVGQVDRDFRIVLF